MNREIKFRDWDGKKFVKSPKYIKTTTGELFYYGADYGGMFSSHETLEKSRGIIQQFTGLKDTNGIEIYEGDILTVKGFDGWKDEIGFRYQATVFYDELQAKFVFAHKPNLSKTGSDFSFWLKEEREIEVIGNIFENPELIK